MDEQNQLTKPKVSASSQKQLDDCEKKFDKFKDEVKSLEHDQLRKVTIREEDSQTKLSSKEIAKNNHLYLKPERTLSDNQKFNEKFADEWEFQKQYVNFIAEHKELIGETIEMWTHPFGGKGASYWKVPTNKPIWAPRYVAEQIKRKRYVRFKTADVNTSQGEGVTYYGSLVAETQIQRLDANPVSSRSSVFMGESNFK